MKTNPDFFFLCENLNRQVFSGITVLYWKIYTPHAINCSKTQAFGSRIEQDLRRILYEDLQFHPYKMKLKQWTNVIGQMERSVVKFCLKMLHLMMFGRVMKLISICPDALISKILAIGLTAIHAKSMSNLCIAHMLLFSALYHIWVW